MDPLALELVSDANFDAQRYLLACSDVAAHYPSGLDPWAHFDAHGRHEARQQLAGEPRIPAEARSPGATLCAIAKDEGAYLIEWIAYHRLLGFERIVIYDNGTTDGSEQSMRAMAEAGLIEYRSWPNVEGRSPQISAYVDAAARCETRWIGFLDIDEFLFLMRDESVSAFLGRFGQDVSAIGMNWRIFGSSGLVAADDRPVVERFTRAAESGFHINRHLKTLAVAADTYRVSPHRVWLMRGLYVDSLGQPIDPGRGFAPPRHDLVQINHYVLKSRSEFAEKKQRGCAMRLPDDPMKFSHRDGEYFKDHDINDVEERSMQAHLPALRLEMRRISRRIEAGVI